MSVFKPDDHRDIERYAAGLSKQEVLDIWCTSTNELSQQDLDYFERSYKRGRALGKAHAVQCLQAQMSQKGGVQGALSYLVRMGEDWPQAVEAKVNNDGGFSFNVVMPQNDT